MQYCPACGSRVEPGDVHCYNCGQQLDDSGTPSSGQSGPYDQRPPDERRRGGRAYDSGGSGQPRDQGHAGQPRDQGRADHGGPPPERQAGSGSAYGPWETDEQYQSGGTYDQQHQPGGTHTQQQGYQQQGYQQYGPPQQPYPQEQQFSESDRQYIEDGKLSYSFKFPLTDEYNPLMLGAACYFLGSWIVVSLFTLVGYTFRMVEAAAYGDTIQPAFDEYLELTKEGFLYWLLFTLYFGVTVALTVGLFVLGDQAGLSSVAGVGAVVLWLAVSYFAPAVFTIYPVTRSLTAAISPNRVAEFALSKRYFVSFLVFTALTIAVSVVTVVLFFMLLFTIVGIVLIFFIVPYIYYVYASFWGATYYEAAEDGVVPEPGGLSSDPGQSGSQPPQG